VRRLRLRDIQEICRARKEKITEKPRANASPDAKNRLSGLDSTAIRCGIDAV